MNSSPKSGRVRPSPRSEAMISSYYVPDELMELILSKCPVKSVVRFKSVSKSWQSLISSRRFSKSHRIQQSRVQNRYIIFGKERRNALGVCVYVVKAEEETSNIYSEGILRKEWVMLYPSPTFNVPLRSCNGLILFTQDYGNNYDYYGYNYSYMLWNPSIRKQTIIGAPQGQGRPWPHLHCDLFYDSTTDDHRVFLSDGACYTVYSCNRGSWSEPEDFPPELTTPQYCIPGFSVDECRCRKHGACADGCFYRVVNENGEILCFDTRDGELHKIRCEPDHDHDHDGVVFVLRAEHGRLYANGYGVRRWTVENHATTDQNKKKKKKTNRLVMVMDNNNTFLVKRKLIDTENKEVAELEVTRRYDGTTEVHTRTGPHHSLFGNLQSRIFPYSEYLLQME